MNLAFHKPHLLALLLLVLFIVAISVLTVLSFTVHTNIWHMGLSLGPDVWFPGF